MLVAFESINDDFISCSDLLYFLSEYKLELSFLLGHICPFVSSLHIDVHFSCDYLLPLVSERLFEVFLVVGHPIVISLHFFYDVLQIFKLSFVIFPLILYLFLSLLGSLLLLFQLQ